MKSWPWISINRASLRNRFAYVRAFIKRLISDIREGDLNYRAMSLVYTTLLSLAPLLAVSFSVLKAFGVHNQMEPFLLQLVAPLEKQGPEIVDRIIGFVNNIRVGVLGSIGFAMLFYTVLSLLQKIEDSFNYVWRTGKSRSFQRRFSDYLSVLLVGPVLVFSALGLTASMASTEFVQMIISQEPFGTLYYLLGLILPYVLIIGAFTFAYRFIPYTHVNFRSALIGGIVAGIGWRGAGWLFAEFVVNSTQYAAIYSSFAILIVFMIWIYLSWLILLVGAQVSFYHQNPRYIRVAERDIKLSYRLFERLGLLVMYLIAECFHQGNKPWTTDALSQRLGLPDLVIEKILDALKKRNLILVAVQGHQGFIPARDLSTITITEILETIRTSPDEALPVDKDNLSVPAVDHLLERLNTCSAQATEGLSLKDLVDP
ncbi:YhjD/YihY/BrkB family envelope integrity protein [Methylocaldum sp.]|uniref:YhjD/YihY/BrkB family envelope integrity protein n=1 Tax=Methylocaldum sp. TaxID=1969727 RepID=UPI002D386F9C|nr:YhjD/YihY/BrkB family envelope integrity protein [Methylocaldum sp.]HYE35342.1 YhjD/YihY/BrkB family envelope integrity protein [Methylocaldum sp.]